MNSVILVSAILLYTLSFPMVSANQTKTEQKTKAASTKKGDANKPIRATTEDGRKVLLKSDGRWEYVQASSSSQEGKPILPQSASKALDEFAKIAGSTELNVEYDEYKSILIGFKASVNQAFRDLPEDSLTNELKTALSKYQVALVAWDSERSIRGRMKDIIRFMPDEFEEYQNEVKDAITIRYALWRENRSSLERANEFSNQYEKP